MIKCVRIFAIALGMTMLAACTQLGLRYASLKVAPDPGLPQIRSATLAQWAEERQVLKAQFAEHVYGPWPGELPIGFGETEIVDAEFLGGRGTLEQTPIRLGAGEASRVFNLVVARPHGNGPQPVIIGQTFSSNCFVYQSLALTGRGGRPCEATEFGGFTGWMVKSILGRYIAKAPLEAYFDRGIAYANFYASEIVPDRNEPAQAVMAGFRTLDGVEGTSALSYWAYGWTAAIDYLTRDDRIDPERIGVFGHSRHGKSALVAAAWEERISLVLAHQSGFGGGSLSRSTAGERIDRVVETYPHWFDPAMATYAQAPDTLPVDQHQLLALAAPTPVLLGNARRDVWSDPNSSYEAAVLADRVYELYGVDGLTPDGLKAFHAQDELSFHMRPGAHGTVPEDITAFFAFIDAHFDTAPGVNEP